MTTTTGGTARVMTWLEEWLQTEWPDLKVYATSVTEEWAAIAVVGPKAREVLRAAGTDIDLAGDAFPHLALKEGTVAGLATRVFRISFSGELASTRSSLRRCSCTSKNEVILFSRSRPACRR